MASSGTAAARADTASAAADGGQYLTFVLGRETFAIAILGIREIIGYTPPTEVPLMPPQVRGVINLRGAVMPVVDLAARLGRTMAPVTKRTCIVIAELGMNGERQMLGMVVDAVTEVLEVSAEDIEPPPSFGGAVRTDFIEGIAKVDGHFVVILNTERMLSVDELAALHVERSSDG
jgi:purine-binding chemotaxis protein CheW